MRRELQNAQELSGVDTSHRLRDRERAENFPVALRLLPRALGDHLHAVYDVARVLDDLADEAEGDRVQLLTAFAADLERVWASEPHEPVLRRLVPTVRECELEQEPFRRLVAAGLQDQRVTTYETYEDLRGYCRLSADPVGQIVLTVFGATNPERLALSDQVCTALQLLEHLQDIGEDRRAGRVYLPQDDLRTHGVRPQDLDQACSSADLRRLVSFETERADVLLEQGARLVGGLSGWARIAVAGYVAGGRATVAALRRADGEVLAADVRPLRRDVLRELTRLTLAPPR